MKIAIYGSNSKSVANLRERIGRGGGGYSPPLSRCCGEWRLLEIDDKLKKIGIYCEKIII